MVVAATQPALSLILCSRNDDYQGNSRWRLETSLNYVAEQVETLGRLTEVEILVADWGSDIPLREVLHLTPTAARIVSFLWVPPGIAKSLQQESSFPEVLALNAVARRANGVFIGRIDQDTLAGRHFLEVFFDLHEGRRSLPVPTARALLFSQRREVPYWFAVRCPAFHNVTRFVRLLGGRCRLAATPDREFWTSFVGVWLIHSAIWKECGGYDERYIHYNWMEVEMILRLRQRYCLIDFGKLIDIDFYHLDHRNPRIPPAVRVAGRMVNPFRPQRDAVPLPYHPNSDDWGLGGISLAVEPGRPSPPLQSGPFDLLVFGALLASTGVQKMIDRPYLGWRTSRILWTGRARRALLAIQGQPLHRWPPILARLWTTRGARLLRRRRSRS